MRIVNEKSGKFYAYALQVPPHTRRYRIARVLLCVAMALVGCAVWVALFLSLEQ